MEELKTSVSGKGTLKVGAIASFLFILAILTFLAFNMIKPVSANITPGLAPGSINPYVVISTTDPNETDSFFTCGNVVHLRINVSCDPTTVCNGSMIASANYSSIGGNQVRPGVNVSGVNNGLGNWGWRIFEFNDTVNCSAVQITNFQAAIVNANVSTYDGSRLNGTNVVILVNMSSLPGCPPASEGIQIPPFARLLSGSIVPSIGECWTNCTGDEPAQPYNASHYVICGPNFGGDTTNFTAVAFNGNFSNIPLVFDIPGKSKINFTNGVNMSDLSKSQAIFQFAMKNLMSGGRIGVNESEWNGQGGKPNLNLPSRLTIYNFSSRFNIPSNVNPGISTRPYGSSSDFTPCPLSTCSGIKWDGQNFTFDVTGFSEYSVGVELSVVLSNTTTFIFDPNKNISFSNSKTINFAYIPTWNSSVSPQTAALWGNFTGIFSPVAYNQTFLSSGALNQIVYTVPSDGLYSWNVVLNDTTGGNDTNVVNWYISIDSTSPMWNSRQSSIVSTYSPSTKSVFNITWNDSSLSAVTIEGNWSGVAQNYTMFSFGLGIYSYNATLPTGQFYWKSYANDSMSNWNTSSIISFTVNKASPSLSLIISPTNSTAYPTTTTAIASIAATDATGTYSISLLRNITQVNSSTTSSDLQEKVLLGAGTYNYTFIYSGSQNYTSATITNVTLVSQGTPAVATFINGQPTNVTVGYPTAVTITANSSSSGVLPLFNISIVSSTGQLVAFTASQSSPVSLSLTAGNDTYNIVFNNTANANWTASANNTLYLKVNKGFPTLSVSGSNVTAQSSVSINANRDSNSVDDDVNYTLWRNTTLVSSGKGVSGDVSDTSSLAVGLYVYTYNSTGGANWTANSTGISFVLQVSSAPAASPAVTPPGGSSGSISSTSGKIIKTFNSILPLVPKLLTTADLAASDTKLTGVSITVNNRVTNVQITVENLDNKPSDVAADVGAKVYDWISIEKSNLDNSNINSAKITFKVEKTWLNSNLIDSSKVSLYRWDSGSWTKLITTKVSEDAIYVYYEATTPGFSYFAIGGEQATPQIVCGNGKCESGEDHSNCPADCPAPVCSESWSCTSWTECAEGTQARSCTDANNCGTTNSKPVTTQVCGGAEVSQPGNTLIAAIAIVLIAIIMIAAVFTKYGLKPKKKKK